MTALLVVAKSPVPGQVKTRLCPPATPERAADIAAACLLDTLEAVRATPGVRPVVAMTGSLDAARRSVELRSQLRECLVIEQRGNGFPARLAAAHADAAARFPGRPVLQIGMDTPQLTPEVLTEACAGLERTEAVFGPADDGGWWAIGFPDPRAAALLADVPTSLGDTGDRTRKALADNGLRVHELREMTDVDTIADARAVSALAPRGRFAAALGGLR
ncbi:DUF2064 domain-containing protein [Saccharopolyspora halophila]|uniref:DUF2064 domain-containing protein n=1 Tax=Saccharopolyspora halophila TaxID=405551 RepID=A0ABN3GVI4_9PSEU